MLFTWCSDFETVMVFKRWSEFLQHLFALLKVSFMRVGVVLVSSSFLLVLVSSSVVASL